jgi:hypothetical protein
MPDLPAPQHSAALNAMLGLPPPERTPPTAVVPRLEVEQHRRQLRRQAAARARARRLDAA